MKPTVLIVDDSLTVQMDLTETFESAGFGATHCATLAAARQALAQSAYSLIILDVLLPDGDGIDWLREIKSTSGMAPVPVMLLSTQAEVNDRLSGLGAGADDYLGKPYDSASVLARARQLIGKTQHPYAESAPRLLLIDDSATFRDSFKEVLEKAGYAVVGAETGEEGLRAAVAIRPSAVIVDGVLDGGMDGAAVIRRLKQDVTFRDTPCLLLTASESPGDEFRALEAGADAYVRKGASIEVILARIVALLRWAGPHVAVHPAASSLLGPKKILAVDDSPTYLHELANELCEEGYDVIPARSGKEALELLQVQPVDCILLDLLMPDLSGQEVCHTIKSAAAWRNIPLLILTAVEDTQAMIEGINAGADDYISKSSDFHVLKARVRAQLRRKHFEDEYRSVREKLMQKEIEAAQAKASQEIAETRAALADELEGKNRELEAFSYSVSHDLRAPLRHIDGFSRLLLEEYAGNLPDQAQHYLRTICDGARRMGLLIDDLLNLSRVGRSELTCHATGLESLVEEVRASLVSETEGRDIEWRVGALPSVECDPALMRQVFANLLSNAVKFTRPRKRAVIEVSASASAGGPVVCVRDNGVGFNMKYAHKLFGVFQRLHRSEDFEGTGVGLATVQRILQKHGGRVWAEAELDGGASFFFSLGRAASTSAIAR